MLNVTDLAAFYGPSQILFDVNLTVGKSEFVTLLGRNGMGKTTTVNAVIGLLRSRSGRIAFEDRDLIRTPTHRVARLGIGLVPEGRQIFPNLTVYENLIATARKKKASASPWTAEHIFEMFPELHARRNVFGTLLSGGEQQMLAIGRALMTNPKLLILDEATEGLAPRIRAEIWDCLKRLKRNGLAILVIDKNINDLLPLADQHYILEKGRIVWSGTSHDLAAEPETQHRYLGI